MTSQPLIAPPSAFARACVAVGDLAVAFDPPAVRALDDTELLSAQRTVAEIRRRADAAAAVVAGEIAHRSRRELGDDGLAQRLGARTPELLVARVAGTSAREAQALVHVGAVMAPISAERPDATPWLAAVAAAVRAGELPVAAADAIRVGLGSPDESVSSASLEMAAATLLRLVPSLTIEQLSVRARPDGEVRDSSTRTPLPVPTRSSPMSAR